ncbi:glycoside hydrolase [Lindgomyces ingoldianus]|uniref:Glycoside hydrolase n=1 Tax=Lindgomyces ingoldianus TaxID=673940 RepID=A0ACB6R2N5_9PLEO|nr:glycoside hydrolase [Lindgomyces ingoldianus]KAF2472597.1 glycoside hydrolase [Lindgomyces ingoldianus]
MAPISSSYTPLTNNWTFKQGSLSSNNSYLPANPAPTEIYLDLLKNGIIADPFKDMNELSVRWIADETWTYRTTFPTPPNHGKPSVITEVRFEGLDTFASVYLNGKLILESENMFVTHRINVTSALKTNAEEENVLEIVFESARKKGLELIDQHPEHRFIVHQTEISRGPVRKAQYHWGWDWGPILLTCGPWKPVLLETYTARIEDVWVAYELSGGLKKVQGKIYARVEGAKGHVDFEIKKPNDILSKLEGKGVDGVYSADFDLDVDLWWPRGYGSQTLYTVSAMLTSEDKTILDQSSKMIGFRKVELIQEKDSVGQSFYFRINNTDIFAGGSCWIPTDSFLTRVDPEIYRNWIKLAVEGNQIMIRIWGGGIYEAGAFYESCDEFGLLVWQDFMFACANYPAYPEYVKSVEEEARQNVRRLRNHPSIVIWAGNNEDYQIVERYGLEYRYKEDKDPQSWLKTDFPARYLYEYLLPKVVDDEAKGVPYHPSSPFGNGVSTVLKVDPTVGDVHQWNVWHGDMKPYQVLPHMGGRFVSEFGMEAYPHLETTEKSITREADRYPGSMAMDFRNKAICHERRLVSYVTENFQIKYDLPGFTYLTQVMQADAIAWAYKSWRRQWGTPGKRQCGGVLVWQLNDCWPTMSWAVVDYYLVPKPAYYAIKRAMAPVTIGVSRKFHNWTMRPADDLWKRDTSHIDMRQIWEDIQFDVWVASSLVENLKGKIVVKFVSVLTGREVHERLAENVSIDTNGTTEVFRNKKVDTVKLQDPNCPFDTYKADPFVIHVSLLVDGQEVATDTSWPDPIKYLTFPDRGIDFHYSSDRSIITVSASKPVKGFVLTEKQGVRLSDNGIDIMPGESKTVVVEDGDIGALEWRHVGM